MNILYISFLSGNKYAGPTYSIPKQIYHQSKFDNIYWLNIEKSIEINWKKYPYYHDIKELKKNSIECLPIPFNNPDLIIIEQFYGIALKRIQYEIMNKKIPYIIIPRGELTLGAQKRKYLKKALMNKIIFFKYANNANAIHYLTDEEKISSGKKWNEKSFIIPNGIDIPKKFKENFSESKIECVLIGRIEPYQKGIYMLIDACELLKEKLVENNVKVSIYGPDLYNKLTKLKKLVENKDLENIIKFYDAVFDKDKEAVLLNSDVFIMSSLFEGHPMALIEALSYGIPCLVTDGSNMKDKVESFDAGWTAENNIESLAKGIEKMIEDFNKIKQKGKNARILAENYQWSKIAEKSHKIYLSILDKSI